jgi:hypothetical protein
VGRKRELGELEAALPFGSGEGVSRRGEPGIGKSGLVDEFASRAEDRGARVLWGRCWEAGGAPAYWPWVQAIRSYIRDEERRASSRNSRAAPATLRRSSLSCRTCSPSSGDLTSAQRCASIGMSGKRWKTSTRRIRSLT